MIIRNNLDALKDISNCLGIVLSMYSHKHLGITVDMSNAALNTAKNMIIGKFADEDGDPKSLNLNEKTARFNYSNSDIDSHKEAGWLIIQGLCSMDYTWLINNSKSLFQLWKYAFSEQGCNLSDADISKSEYRESLISEFFIKKAALSSLRKFILTASDYINSSTFQTLVPKILNNALSFFIPYDNKKVIVFYKHILREKYKEVKSILYDCYRNIPNKLYSSKYNQILYPLCDEVTSLEYIEYSYDYIYSNLNFFDTFTCEKSGNMNSNQSTKINSNNIFDIDNFTIEKYNISLTDRLNTDVNSKIVNSAITLLVEIMLDQNLNTKNRQLIFKHFLTHMNEINIKSSDKGKLNKAINIIYALFSILKKSNKANIFIINDESIFTNSKMLFDMGFKIDNILIRRLSAEGHALLIKVSGQAQQNIKHYFTAMEFKLRNDLNTDPQQFANNFYMVANIFRFNDFSNISPILDDYMNFMISYFNKIEDLFNPYISQSILIITEILTLSKW